LCIRDARRLVQWSEEIWLRLEGLVVRLRRTAEVGAQRIGDRPGIRRDEVVNPLLPGLLELDDLAWGALLGFLAVEFGQLTTTARSMVLHGDMIRLGSGYKPQRESPR
jgi:hypothetical protein